MRSFMKIKSSRNGVITLSFTDEGKTCHSREFYVADMSFNAVRENKILAKISEFTVLILKSTGSTIRQVFIGDQMESGKKGDEKHQ